MVQLFLLPFYCGVRRVFDTFNLQAEICHKKIPDYVLFDGVAGGNPFGCPVGDPDLHNCPGGGFSNGGGLI